jgi:hypothetical protein
MSTANKNFCPQLGCGLVTGALFRAEQGTTRLSFLPGLSEGQAWSGQTFPSKEPRHE